MNSRTNTIKDITKLFNFLQPYCKAIYLGGSYTQTYIKNPHDIDFICFAYTELDRLRMILKLTQYQNIYKDEFQLNEDWIQTRSIEHEEHSYGSYIYKDMILLCGEKINFKFDILDKDRKEYINILKTTHLHNEKRLYQLYRGYLIIKKNSYELSSDEIEEINKLHDCTASAELKEKVLKLIEELEN